MQKIIEKFIQDYIQDVVVRHEETDSFKDKRYAFWKDKPLEMLEQRLKEIFALNVAYHQSTDKDFNIYNDYELFMLSIPKNAIEFDDLVFIHPQFQKLKKEYYQLHRQKKDSAKLKRIYYNKVNRLFSKEFSPEKQREMKHNYLQCLLTKVEMEYNLRQQIQADFASFPFIGHKDKGNCTKALTVSLYNMQKKYGI